MCQCLYSWPFQPQCCETRTSPPAALNLLLLSFHWNHFHTWSWLRWPNQNSYRYQIEDVGIYVLSIFMSWFHGPDFGPWGPAISDFPPHCSVVQTVLLCGFVVPAFPWVVLYPDFASWWYSSPIFVSSWLLPHNLSVHAFFFCVVLKSQLCSEVVLWSIFASWLFCHHRFSSLWFGNSMSPYNPADQALLLDGPLVPALR